MSSRNIVRTNCVDFNAYKPERPKNKEEGGNRGKVGGGGVDI